MVFVDDGVERRTAAGDPGASQDARCLNGAEHAGSPYGLIPAETFDRIRGLLTDDEFPVDAGYPLIEQVANARGMAGFVTGRLRATRSAQDAMTVFRGDMLLTDFPFSDGAGSKLRLALAVQNDRDSRRLANVILAMITSLTTGGRRSPSS